MANSKWDVISFLADWSGHVVDGLVIEMLTAFGFEWSKPVGFDATAPDNGDPIAIGFLTFGQRRESIPVRSRDQMRRAIEERGLGGSIDGELPGGGYVTTLDIAEAVARCLGIGNPGGYAIGRGTRYKRILEQLRGLATIPAKEDHAPDL